MSKVVPDKWKPRDKDITWAIEKFGITQNEAKRQLEEFCDHEFRRNYTDWNRAFRNWFRSADKYDLLKRERKPWKPEVVTDEMRAEDQRKFDDQIKRFSKSGVR